MPTIERIAPKSFARVIRILAGERRCPCCDSPLPRYSARPFCDTCVERARPHEVNDPYDDLGGGD
jgi:hypothetical protein